MSGFFITLEGGDGVGKTTQSSLLAEWLESEGHEVVLAREPGGTPLGIELRRLILRGGDEIGHVDARSEALMYAADRAQNIATRVRPALERGAVVVQDRFIDSSLAYQGVGRVLDVDDVRRINEWAAGGLWPDVTVLLDIDHGVAMARTASRETSKGDVPDRIEAEAGSFHNSVRQAFLALAAEERERYLVVDASQTPETIHSVIRERIAPLLGR